MPYFETSVLTFFGVNEVFENAIRAALCARFDPAESKNYTYTLKFQENSAVLDD